LSEKPTAGRAIGGHEDFSMAKRSKMTRTA